MLGSQSRYGPNADALVDLVPAFTTRTIGLRRDINLFQHQHVPGQPSAEESGEAAHPAVTEVEKRNVIP